MHGLMNVKLLAYVLREVLDKFYRGMSITAVGSC
jgi:hypothetical protein